MGPPPRSHNSPTMGLVLSTLTSRAAAMHRPSSCHACCAGWRTNRVPDPKEPQRPKVGGAPHVGLNLPLEHGTPEPPSFRARGSAWFFSPVCALEVNGAEGGSVTFHLQDLKGEKLAWSFNGDTMLTITLGESLNPSFFENSYKSRVTFPNNGSSLTISQLGKKDAGTYTAKNSVYKASFTLRVHSECLFVFRPHARSEGWEMC